MKRRAHDPVAPEAVGSHATDHLRPTVLGRRRSFLRLAFAGVAGPAIGAAISVSNIRAPMIMSTFADRHDLSGRTVFPITTYAMSGLGTTAEDYRRSCAGARIGEGLAVRGEKVRDAGAAIDAWLRRTGLLATGARR